jgi:hypothetical protein
MAKRNGPRETPPSSYPRSPDPLPWIGLGVLAFAFLSYPWVSPFAPGSAWLGIPALLWYVFGVMAALVGLAAMLRPEV